MPIDRAARALLLPLLLGGCYYYAPGADDGPRPNADVRVVLEREWAADHAIGEWSAGTPYLRGTLVRSSPEDLLIVPSPGQPHPAYRAGGANAEILAVPRTRVLVVQEKRLDRRRSSMMIAGATLLAGVFVVVRMNEEPGERDSAPPGAIPDAIRIHTPF